MARIYELILIPWLILGIIAFIALFWVNAPYGKFSSNNIKFALPYKLGWIIQEIISPLSFSYFFFINGTNKSIITWFFFTTWITHYIYRSIIFPLRMKNNTSEISLSVLSSAIFFNAINGFINGYYLGNLATYSNIYIYKLNFIFGLFILIIGVIINIKSDNILITIKNKDCGYKIPKGFLYKYISCPNYFGEIIEWFGFALMTLSFPALIFFIWTISNLVPRAIATHRWYKNKFDDYPTEKKIIFPFIY